MGFWIQASKPRYSGEMDIMDESLEEAIETLFPLNTECFYIVWNNIHIPLSYKYDASIMYVDIIRMINTLLSTKEGEFRINWPSNTFHSTWEIKYSEDTISIQAAWESVCGKIEHILNTSGGISISKKEFISEWKEILLVILKGLKKFYNKHSFHEDIEKLEGMLVKINESGSLYRNTI